MIYTDKWAFIHIPKTSGINLKLNAVRKLNDVKSPFVYKDNMFEDLTQVERGVQHNPYWWWQKKKIITTQKAFSIVRNPYDRAASFYNYVTSIHSHLNISFEDFYTNEGKTGIGWNFGREDIRWNYRTTQLEFIKPLPGKSYPKIYRYETDLQKLEAYLNLDITSTRLNSQPHFDVSEFYNIDRSRIELVNQLFEEDFDMFNYEIMEP